MPPLAPTHIDVHIAPLRRDSQRTQAPKSEIRPPIGHLVDLAEVRKALYERLDRHLSLETRECAAQTDMGVAAKRYVAIAFAMHVEYVRVFEVLWVAVRGTDDDSNR